MTRASADLWATVRCWENRMGTGPRDTVVEVLTIPRLACGRQRPLAEAGHPSDLTGGQVRAARTARERLGEIIAPTLVLHVEDDPFFPIGNGEALAAEIPGARLVRLDRVGHRLPAHAVPVVADELLAHTAD